VTRALFALMFAASLVLWFGVPVAWLWVGGRLQGATHSLGAAVGVALLGMVASVLLAVPVLHWLARKHQSMREARGLQDLGVAPLEGVMVVSAVLALIGFGVWFLFLSGAEPLPLGLPK
jgi:Na+/glutamate symporter